MKHLYGKFSMRQISEIKELLRKSIFFCLVCVDEKTSCEIENVDVNKYFDSLMFKISGLNKLLMEQVELVTILSLLQAAKDLYNSDNFKYKMYRKLILDAGSEILKLKEE